MIAIFNFTLLLTFITLSASSDFSLKGDPCSKFDTCSSKSVRTCSCDSSCHMYGTCCHDMKISKQNLTVFQCYSRRTANPVFAKRSCPEDYPGHVGVIGACLDEEEDEMDVKNNLLMTSGTTKITYWNKNCAKCNDELSSDLEFWNIVVSCPSHKEVDRYLIRKNLTFDQDKLQWGLLVGDEFLQCSVKYSPPYYADEVRHCTPNVTSKCPDDYKNEDIAAKCSEYYAERKLKNSDSVFKNIHCAMCNGIDVKDLECPGMSGPEDHPEESDFRSVVEVTFTNGEWLQKLPGKEFECSKGFSYDPFREKCRIFEFKEEDEMVPNSAQVYGKESWAILMIFVALFLKVTLFAQLFAAEQSF